MNKYNYRAFCKHGDKLKGSILAASKAKAVEDLNLQKYTVVEIKEDHLYKVYKINMERFDKFSKVSDQQFILFLVQLESLLKTGLNIVQASDIILELFSEDKKFSKILNHVFSNVKKGETFSESLELYDNIFPEIMINMIKVGEQVGELENVISELVVFYETRNKNKKQITTMLIYPSFIMGFSLFAVLVLLYFVVPQFVNIYKTAKEDLPMITQVVINVSNLFRSNWQLFILALFLLVIGALLSFKIHAVKNAIDKLLIKLPITSQIVVNSNLVYISSSLSLMFEKSYDKLHALDLIKNNTSNSIYKEYLFLMYINIYNGNKLLDDFEETSNLPMFFKQMIMIGEESSSLAPLLRKSADYYQEKLDRYINSMKGLLEPMLIVGVLIIVLPIILAVLIPMVDVYGNL